MVKPIEMEVKINGKGPFRFGFDTGQAIELIVSPKLVEDLKLPKIGSVTATDGAPGRGKDLPLAKADKVEFSGRSWSNVQALVIQLPSTGRPVVGSVGFPLFKEHLLTVDVRNGKVSATKGALRASDSDTLKYLPRQGSPFIPITIGEVDAYAHLDTGAERGILIPSDMQKDFKFKDKPRFAGKMATLFGVGDIYQATIDGDIVLGSLILKNPIVQISDLLNFINVGRDVMAKAVFTFDQENLLVKVVPF